MQGKTKDLRIAVYLCEVEGVFDGVVATLQIRLVGVDSFGGLVGIEWLGPAGREEGQAQAVQRRGTVQANDGSFGRVFGQRETVPIDIVGIVDGEPGQNQVSSQQQAGKGDLTSLEVQLGAGDLVGFEDHQRGTGTTDHGD